MKIKKKAIFLILEIVVLAIVIGLGFWGNNVLNTTWEDSATWTTEERITLPKVAEDLKVEYSVLETVDSTTKTMNFKADYCYLYEITPSDDGNTSTINCSLLPMYYAEREMEIPKDWKESADIQIVLNKNDPAPTEFLGRQDLSFDSVSSLGSNKVPVSIEIKGEYIYPENTIQNKFSHWQDVKNEKKTVVKVTLSDLSVINLEETKEEDKVIFVEKWRTNVAQEISAYTSTLKLDEKTGIDYLNTASALFTTERLYCTNLSSCEPGYEINPAEKFIYYIYGQQSTDKTSHSKAIDAISVEMFPFNNKERGWHLENEVCEDCARDWQEFSAYRFPVCPINEIMNGKSNENTKIFEQYVTKFISLWMEIPNNETDMLNSLTDYDLSILEEEGSWDRTDVDNINIGCYYLLKNGVNSSPKIKNRVSELYFGMLSISLDKEIEFSETSINNAIYESIAYSPYKTNYITDSFVMTYLENAKNDSEEAADLYTEWRSLLHTLIFFYLTNEN